MGFHPPLSAKIEGQHIPQQWCNPKTEPGCFTLWFHERHQM